MSDERNNNEHAVSDDRKPKVFGLRAAALAGIVVSASAVTIGFSGTFDEATDSAFTTCCPPIHSVME